MSMRLEPSRPFDCIRFLKVNEVTDFILVFLTQTLTTIWAICLRFLFLLYQSEMSTSSEILHRLRLILRHLHPLRKW
jgi:hypothetical protein